MIIRPLIPLGQLAATLAARGTLPSPSPASAWAAMGMAMPALATYEPDEIDAETAAVTPGLIDIRLRCTVYSIPREAVTS